MLFGSGLSFPFDIKKLAQQKHGVNNDNDVLYMRIRELENRVEFLENTIGKYSDHRMHLREYDARAKTVIQNFSSRILNILIK